MKIDEGDIQKKIEDLEKKIWDTLTKSYVEGQDRSDLVADELGRKHAYKNLLILKRTASLLWNIDISESIKKEIKQCNTFISSANDFGILFQIRYYTRMRDIYEEAMLDEDETKR